LHRERSSRNAVTLIQQVTVLYYPSVYQKDPIAHPASKRFRRRSKRPNHQFRDLALIPEPSAKEMILLPSAVAEYVHLLALGRLRNLDVGAVALFLHHHDVFDRCNASRTLHTL